MKNHNISKIITALATILVLVVLLNLVIMVFTMQQISKSAEKPIWTTSGRMRKKITII